uniref:Major facilitator superfamily (MFS) profile domain-containing protein n=1 Tax=Timema poppense TaxID=170557 RepID=A0A7R9GV43_TIMPO|nr:unnamed protein product [Timema poppensis]
MGRGRWEGLDTGSCCKKRHIVMAVVAFKVLLMSALGSMFPLAVIAMVKRPNNTVNSTDCPINTNVTINDSGGNENGEFDWDELTQSYIFAVGGVGTLMSMLIGARLCELYGVKFVVGISMVITAVLTLLSPSAARLSVWLFIVINFTKGVFSFYIVVFIMASSRKRRMLTEKELNEIISNWESASDMSDINDSDDGVSSSSSEREPEHEVDADNNMTQIQAPMYPGFNILFSSWLPVDERTRSAAYVFSAMILGTLIPMFTAGELMDKFGWPSVYYLSGLSVIPFMITWVFFVYDTPHHHPTISNEEKSYIIKNSQRDYGSSFISALPHLANLASNVLCSTLSHWLRMKGFISQLTAYRIFNFFGVYRTKAGYLISNCQCGSALTYINKKGVFTDGTMDSDSGLCLSDQQTRSSWGNVFYVSAAVSTIPFFIFYFLGSVEEQPWNIIHKEEDEEAIVEVGPENETNAYDPAH